MTRPASRRRSSINATRSRIRRSCSAYAAASAAFMSSSHITDIIQEQEWAACAGSEAAARQIKLLAAQIRQLVEPPRRVEDPDPPQTLVREDERHLVAFRHEAIVLVGLCDQRGKHRHFDV